MRMLDLHKQLMDDIQAGRADAAYARARLLAHHPPLHPGDLPLPPTSAERRRLAMQDAAELAAVLLDAEAPGRPRPAAPTLDRCRDSKYGVHRFVAAGGRVCEFCGRSYPDCLLTKGDR